MALRIPIVSDWASAQQAFDFIAQHFPLKAQDIANGAIGHNQLATGVVLELATTGTTEKIDVGTSSVTFTASTFTPVVTVSHSIGAAPRSVVVTMSVPAGTTGAIGANLIAASKTSTQFQIQGNSSASISGTFNVQWIAVG